MCSSGGAECLQLKIALGLFGGAPGSEKDRERERQAGRGKRRSSGRTEQFWPLPLRRRQLVSMSAAAATTTSLAQCTADAARVCRCPADSTTHAHSHRLCAGCSVGACCARCSRRGGGHRPPPLPPPFARGDPTPPPSPIRRSVVRAKLSLASARAGRRALLIVQRTIALQPCTALRRRPKRGAASFAPGGPTRPPARLGKSLCAPPDVVVADRAAARFARVASAFALSRSFVRSLVRSAMSSQSRCRRRLGAPPPPHRRNSQSPLSSAQFRTLPPLALFRIAPTRLLLPPLCCKLHSLPMQLRQQHQRAIINV